MADLILVDTDILIDAGRSIKEAVTALEKAESEAALGISTITQMELIVGCRNKTELRKLEKFLRRFSIIPYLLNTVIVLLRGMKIGELPSIGV